MCEELKEVGTDDELSDATAFGESEQYKTSDADFGERRFVSSE